MRDRYPHEFSGGQRQRIAIARALVPSRELIIARRADLGPRRVGAGRRSSRCSSELQRETRLAYLFITHDLAVVRAVADDVAVMKDGKVVEHGTVRAQIFEAPQRTIPRR
jgi:ABC-type microcin C transport system duplicated ATPase subunit YejF